MWPTPAHSSSTRPAGASVEQLARPQGLRLGPRPRLQHLVVVRDLEGPEGHPLQGGLGRHARTVGHTANTLEGVDEYRREQGTVRACRHFPGPAARSAPRSSRTCAARRPCRRPHCCPRPAPAGSGDEELALWVLLRAAPPRLRRRRRPRHDARVAPRPAGPARRTSSSGSSSAGARGSPPPTCPALPVGRRGPAELARAFFALCETDTGSESVARFVQREADEEQLARGAAPALDLPRQGAGRGDVDAAAPARHHQGAPDDDRLRRVRQRPPRRPARRPVGARHVRLRPRRVVRRPRRRRAAGGAGAEQPDVAARAAAPAGAGGAGPPGGVRGHQRGAVAARGARHGAARRPRADGGLLPRAHGRRRGARAGRGARPASARTSPRCPAASPRSPSARPCCMLAEAATATALLAHVRGARGRGAEAAEAVA